jgi:beta-glucosidase/6-phospho-beta-glucosidase/beta-galactosidase
MIHDNLDNASPATAPSTAATASSILSDPAFAKCLPPTFALGFATASYQIEGGYDSDGKSPSNWDQFLHGKTDNGEVANDSYHRVAEDIKCLKEYGASAYRFSVSWPRVIPQGKSVNCSSEAAHA